MPFSLYATVWCKILRHFHNLTWLNSHSAFEVRQSPLFDFCYVGLGNPDSLISLISFQSGHLTFKFISRPHKQ